MTACTLVDEYLLRIVEDCIDSSLINKDHIYDVRLLATIAFSRAHLPYFDFYAKIDTIGRIPKYGDTLLAVELPAGGKILLDGHIVLKERHFPIRHHLACFSNLEVVLPANSPRQSVRYTWRMYTTETLCSLGKHLRILDKTTSNLYVFGSMLVDEDPAEYEKYNGELYRIDHSTP